MVFVELVAHFTWQAFPTNDSALFFVNAVWHRCWLPPPRPKVYLTRSHFGSLTGWVVYIPWQGLMLYGPHDEQTRRSQTALIKSLSDFEEFLSSTEKDVNTYWHPAVSPSPLQYKKKTRTARLYLISTLGFNSGNEHTRHPQDEPA